MRAFQTLKSKPVVLQEKTLLYTYEVLLHFLVKTEGINSLLILQDHLKATDLTAEESALKRMSMYLIIEIFKVIT